MEVLSQINFVPIIVAPILMALVRFVLYSDNFFGSIWLKLIDLRESEKTQFPFMNYLYFMFLNFILAITISTIAGLTNSASIIDGIGLGLMIGLGIGMPIMLPQYIFAQMDSRLVAIDFLFQFLNILTISILVTVI